MGRLTHFFLENMLCEMYRHLDEDTKQKLWDTKLSDDFFSAVLRKGWKCLNTWRELSMQPSLQKVMCISRTLVQMSGNISFQLSRERILLNLRCDPARQCLMPITNLAM